MAAHRTSSAEKLVDFLIVEQSDSWEEVPIRNIHALPPRTLAYLADSAVYRSVYTRRSRSLFSAPSSPLWPFATVRLLVVVFARVSCSFFPFVARYATDRPVTEGDTSCEACAGSRDVH